VHWPISWFPARDRHNLRLSLHLYLPGERRVAVV
jgi:hypothetical protein